MGTLLYVGRSQGVGDRLQKMIEMQIPNEKIDVFRTVEKLSERLHQPLYDVEAGVLLSSTKGDFEKILTLQNLLSGFPILLVLPDGEPDTVSKAYRLSPRFVTYLDRGLMDVAAVLKKMLERSSLLKSAEKA